MSANEITFLLSCLAIVGVYFSIQKFIKVRSSKQQKRIDAGEISTNVDEESDVNTDYLIAKKKKEQLSEKGKFN